MPLDQIARCRGELNVDIELDSDFGDRCSDDRSRRLSAFAIYARAEAKGLFGISSFAASWVCYAVRRLGTLKAPWLYLRRPCLNAARLQSDPVQEHFEYGLM